MTSAAASPTTVSETAGTRRYRRTGAWLVRLLAAVVVAAAPSEAGIVAGPIVNPANGHAYYLLSSNTWAAAEAEAVALGGHLTTIRGADEDNWVYDTFSSYGGVQRDLWIGLNDLASAGTFVWVTGSTSAYRNWNTGEPNNFLNERYGGIYGPASSAPRTWNNFGGGTSAYGVVEVVLPVSLAITSGPSSVTTVAGVGMTGYTATATFDDGTTATVTPVWSVSPTTYASIDTAGILTVHRVPSDQTVTITASFTVGATTRTDSKIVTIVAEQDAGTVYFSDDFESGLAKWEVSGQDWATITTDSRRGTTCITDSPSGDYPANANSIITMRSAVNLSGTVAPMLSFWQKFSIPWSGDSVYVEVSQDGGLTWAAVPGGTWTGFAVSTWTKTTLDLTAYKGPSVLLRFRLRDYSGTIQADGWYIDDVEITEPDTQTTPFPFFDNFENGLGNWEVSGRDWALITADYRSAGHSITDSPGGSYPADSMATVTLAHPIDLSGTVAPVLSFWQKFSIPWSGDSASVEVSQDGGVTWATVSGGTFTGAVSTWTKQILELTAYKGTPVLLRFRLRDYSGTIQADGWYLDDVALYDNGDVTAPETTITSFPPNPTPSTAATFGFISSESLSTFECALDAGAYAPCTTPVNYTALALGSHTFSVRATDYMGNVDATPASYTWTVLVPPPTVTSVTPTSGPATGGTVVTIKGTGFVTGATVTFGGTAATGVTVVSATSITATTPAHAAGAVNVVVTNPDSQSGTLTNGFTYQATATVTSVAPTSGPLAGGTVVTITGTGFVTGATVTFGGTAATGVTVVSATSITATTPAHAAGAVNVVVTNPDSQSGTLTNGFTYRAAPTVTQVRPAHGPIAGGTTITISGTGFSDGATVTVGGMPASGVVFLDSTSLMAITPAHAAGLAAVTATNPDGQSYTVWDVFTYVRAATSSDFDADWTSDILWRHATRGEIWLWPMDVAYRTAETYVRTVGDLNWEIRGLGDQTGDGKADILWRHQVTGEIYLWPMDGSTPLGEIYVGTVSTDYDIVATGDFDGDGKSDILWRHATSGDVWVWLMDGPAKLSEMYIDRVDPGYVVKGAGDLDADGKADIVWHHATAGEVWVWPMDGTTRLSENYVGTVEDTHYQIGQVADFDGDRKADLLWWNTVQGDLWIWPMDGATRLAATYVGVVPDTNYRIAGAGDYDGDGKADILWHHATLGEVWVWLMNGPIKLSENYVASVPDVGYQIVKAK